MPRRRRRTPGATTANGYGWQHQQARQRWAAKLRSAGSLPCTRCGYPVWHGQDWHLDHDDHDRTKYRGIAHAKCNLSAGGRKSQWPRAPVDPEPKVSTKW